MQREEPYLVLTSTEVFRDENVPSGTVRQVLHGCRQLVFVKCWVKSRNERNPYPLLPAVRPGTQRRLPVINWRKVGMTSSHHGPYDQGYTRATMAHTKRSDLARASGPHKVRRSPDWSLQLDSMKSESLVIVDQNATVNTFPGLVHTARHTMGVGCKRSR